MSEKCRFPTRKSLYKVIMGYRIYLGRGFDIVHGKGFFAHCYAGWGIGFGFDKTNKFTAVRNAIKGLS